MHLRIKLYMPRRRGRRVDFGRVDFGRRGSSIKLFPRRRSIFKLFPRRRSMFELFPGRRSLFKDFRRWGSSIKLFPRRRSMFKLFPGRGSSLKLFPRRTSSIKFSMPLAMRMPMIMLEVLGSSVEVWRVDLPWRPRAVVIVSMRRASCVILAVVMSKV